MHIAIDHRLSAYRAGGIPQYTAQLAAALAELLAPDERLTLIEHRRAALPAHSGEARLARRRVWTPPHHRWEQILLPLELAGLRADVLHFPDFIPLFRLRTPAVITVHDLAFLRFPEILDDAARRYYDQIGRAVRHAAAIIAVSESTRRDLLELLDVDAARISVIAEAAAPHFRRLNLPPDAQRCINGHLLRADDFALFVGTIEPRKNLPTLLRALHHWMAHAPGEAPTLVVAGPRGWLDAPVFALVRELRLDEQVRFIGGVSSEDLVWLYNACRVYLHPELYSGFGLPILEAMQCGAPVIAADAASLPEVAGTAGLLLPPLDVAAWAETWRRVWWDAAVRARLRAAGLAQAARFSWPRAAAATLAVYRQASLA
ncbi:glycosyltransferase family 4 protein [Kallotenue papyrolyticum]|uniref:glycosyltransferase family 4 protein n=1 Tax=Kallotenue papyrolyticum TaxID=1325125 RepID=UPI0004786062|nr:glycosyltransferase family 1 protein [Kallotenue papyrolyticum]